MTKPSQYNSYDLTTGVIVDMEEMIHMLSPSDVPLLGQNGAEGGTALSTGSCFEKKVEWMDEELLLPVSNITANWPNNSTTIAHALPTGDGLKFSVGDVVALENERLLVSVVATDTVTFLRAQFGSSAAAHTYAAGPPALPKLLILGQALPEGSDPEAPRAKDRTGRSNYTQIFGPTSVRVSATENVVRKYGLGGTTEFDKQVANRAREQLIQLEQAALYGVSSAGALGSGADIRTMGGIFSYITTNNNSASTAVTEALLLDQIQASYDLGGRIDRALVGSKQKRNISALANGITIQVGRVDNGRGQIVDYLDTDFGRVSILLDRWVRQSDIALYDRDQAELLTLRPMQFEMLAKTGDSIYGQIVQERTMRFRRERHAAKFTGLTS